MKEIPEINNPEPYPWCQFCDEEFVEIKNNEIFEVCMQYPLLGMKEAEKRCLVRAEVYEMLCKAYKRLPKGYRFRILDAWRPFKLQRELYIKYSAKIIQDFTLQSCTEEERNYVIQKFVSKPVFNRDMPPVHTTGGAVDLTIIDNEGQELDMGTEFDAFTDKTYTSYFEHEQPANIRDNRRMLYDAMCEVGFTNLPSEWWHYDYGDRFWAYYKGKPALYRGVFEMEELEN